MTPHVSLIHGWGMRPQIWHALRDTLEPACKVATPALPGHDDTPTPSPADWLATLAGQLPDAGTVLGWSLGGQLAMQLALDYPEKVARLVLVATTPCFVQQPDWPHALDATTVRQFNDDFAAHPAQIAKRFVALQAMGEPDRRGVTKVLNGALAPLEATHLPALAHGLGLLSALDLRARVPAIECPVRIFHGSRDALMPVAAAHWLADHMPCARLTEFTDAGHAPFVSHERKFGVMLQRFIHG